MIVSLKIFRKYAILWTSEGDFCLGREGRQLNSIEHQCCARHLRFLTHPVLVRTRIPPCLTAGVLQLAEAADLPGAPGGKGGGWPPKSDWQTLQPGCLCNIRTSHILLGCALLPRGFAALNTTLTCSRGTAMNHLLCAKPSAWGFSVPPQLTLRTI